MSALPELIEHLAVAWLKNSEIGGKMLAEMSLDDAIDAVFELLNAGFLKVAVDRRRQPIGFTFNPVPRPPARVILRPHRQTWFGYRDAVGGLWFGYRDNI